VVVGVIKADGELGPGALYETIELKEPTPVEFREHVAGKVFPRNARINISHRDRAGVWKHAVCRLRKKKILTKESIIATARPCGAGGAVDGCAEGSAGG